MDPAWASLDSAKQTADERQLPNILLLLLFIVEQGEVLDVSTPILVRGAYVKVPTAQLNQDIITGGIQCAIVDIDVVGRRHRHNSIAAPSVDGHMTDVGLLSPEVFVPWTSSLFTFSQHL